MNEWIRKTGIYGHNYFHCIANQFLSHHTWLAWRRRGTGKIPRLPIEKKNSIPFIIAQNIIWAFSTRKIPTNFSTAANEWQQRTKKTKNVLQECEELAGIRWLFAACDNLGCSGPQEVCPRLPPFRSIKWFRKALYQCRCLLRCWNPVSVTDICNRGASIKFKRTYHRVTVVCAT